MDSSDGKQRFPHNIVAVLRHVPGAALLFAVVPLFVLGYLGWYYYGAEKLDQAFYSLKQENLIVTQQPDWIKHSNVLEEVFSHSRLDRISLLDPTANATIAQAFETHNWVRSTNRVAKAVGGKVDVDLIYRRPMAMVYYDPQDADEKAVFYAIDEEGIILPGEDFDKASVFAHLMIFASNARPTGEAGMAFGDARIAEALSLCKYLNDERAELGLQEIWVDHEGRSTGASPWVLTIVTRDKRTIHWGHAPDFESVGESAAAEKHQRMVAWLRSTKAKGDERIDLRFPLTAQPVSTR